MIFVMRKFSLLMLMISIAACGYAQVKAVHLLTENQVDPISIDAPSPRFSWRMDEGNKRNALQTAYEIKAFTYTTLNKGKREVWNSGKIPSSESVYIGYKGEQLLSAQKYYWQVRI